MLREHFVVGTERTVTGSSIGAEIETDFVQEDTGDAITTTQAATILATTERRPLGCQQKLELGRQKIEISVGPHSSASLMLEATQEGLAWLYEVAHSVGARPVFQPDWGWDLAEQLLWVQEERDEIWVALDGQPALEHLCRCSSVQFTVAVHPSEAICVINRLWKAEVHTVDYKTNDQQWRKYITASRAGYRSDRYGGPAGFKSIDDYVAQLSKHKVVMHQGQSVSATVDDMVRAAGVNFNIELFLRSIWWHYRLRRYGDTLVVEIRPIGRRTDDQIPEAWKMVAHALGW